MTDSLKNYQPKIKRNHLLTTDNKPKCIYDMLIRYHPSIPRSKHVFTYRGDMYEKDPDRMLGSLIRLAAKDPYRFIMVEIHNNTVPLNEPGHYIFKMVVRQGVIDIEYNHISHYQAMLSHVIIPDWMKK